jgi:hypothetical protein
MVRKFDLIIRILIKRIEKLPRKLREFLDSLLDFILVSRSWSEIQIRRAFNKSTHPLSFELARETGFSKFSTDKVLTERLIEFALRVKKQYLTGSTEKGNSKEYLRQIWDLSNLNVESKFVLEWAVETSNLKAISKYFGGKTPLLHEVSVFYSPESDANSNKNWEGSQLFHMDGGGTQCVKLWLLCQDVEDEHGPTVVVSASQSERIAKQIKYSPGSRIDSDHKLSQIEKLETHKLTGKKGSWFATDTDRSFHYGSRTSEKSSRLVIMFHYVDNNSSYYVPILSRHYRRQLKPLPIIAKEVALGSRFAFESLKYRLKVKRL